MSELATRFIRVDYCDVCGKETDTIAFRISEQGGESRKVVVCMDPDHGAPFLRNLITRAIETQAKAGMARPRSRVYSAEDVKAAMHTPPKGTPPVRRPRKAP